MFINTSSFLSRDSPCCRICCAPSPLNPPTIQPTNQPTTLREHQPYADEQQQLYPQHAAPNLQFLALIAFPHFYASSLGEFQSRRWRYWGGRLAALGIPVRCCFLDSLSYLRGITDA